MQKALLQMNVQLSQAVTDNHRRDRVDDPAERSSAGERGPGRSLGFDARAGMQEESAE